MTSEAEIAGRDLDALVAERVMGARILARSDMLIEAERVWREQPQCTEFFRGFHAHREDGGIICYQDFQPYSTDIRAAWEIVEKLERDGWACTLDSDGAGLWHTDFWIGPDTRYGAGYFTAPLAICRAALKAIGGGLS